MRWLHRRERVPGTTDSTSSTAPGAPAASSHPGQAADPGASTERRVRSRPQRMQPAAPEARSAVSPATAPTPPPAIAGDNGPVAAAILAAGIGCAALGLIVVLAAASPAVASLLTFSAAVGPLSGKTTVAVIVWVLAWILLHMRWRQRQVSFLGVYALTLLLVAVGLLGTFPPFYELFAH